MSVSSLYVAQIKDKCGFEKRQNYNIGENKAQIKAEYGMSVSSLYVAQIKDKCGFEKRQNYNIGENKAHVPNCPPEKEKAILKAFKHFRMI